MPRWSKPDACPASPARLVATRATHLVRGLLLAVCVPILTAPALGAPTYRISFERSGYGAQYSVTQSTPFQHADSYGVPGSSAIFSGSAFAYPGHVGMDNRVEQFWTSSATSRYDVYSSATATDFLITGPAGPWVVGDLHLRVRASLAHVGGYVGNAGHGARLNVDARARSGLLVAMGDLYSTNYDTHGTGILTGLTSPDLDFPFVLSGTFPVGTPFDVYIRVFGIETTYGNSGSSPNPGYARTDAGSNSSYGLFLEEVSGQVMTLPAGYTLNSASWGVVDNQFTSPVGVEDGTPGADLRLDLAGANPSSGASRVALSVPRDGLVQVVLFDVAGRVQRTLFDGWQSAGTLMLAWDGRTAAGTAAPAGLYFIRAESEGRSVTRAIVRVR